MSEPKHLIDESDIGSGEQEIANDEVLQKEIEKIPSGLDSPDRETESHDGAPNKQEDKVGTS